jgi:magnesium-transporting ATPase (P-type)
MLPQTIYDDWLMAFFNILITSLPPLAVATFEQDIPEKAIKEVRNPPILVILHWAVKQFKNCFLLLLLLQHPEAYERVQNHTVFTYKTLSLWFLSATYHSLGTRAVSRNTVDNNNNNNTELTPHTHNTTIAHAITLQCCSSARTCCGTTVCSTCTAARWASGTWAT